MPARSDTARTPLVTDRRRARVRIRGVVQGVGFRPFVYALAARHGLAGWVRNDGEGVLVEVEGAHGAVSAFVDALVPSAPPLARVEGVEHGDVALAGDTTFRILASGEVADRITPVSPDMALCAECRRELQDPSDRRFRYPFINCTNCGPRFTIVRSLPYDRPRTTMAPFRMCAACQREYDDPADRRYHAQPNACPACGPALSWRDHAGERPGTPEAMQAAIDALTAGRIVAVKGLGGYHLACLATSAEAIRVLRQRKGRIDKPFAVMAPSLEVTRSFAQLSTADAALLESPERPIVIVRRLATPQLPLPAELAPGHDTIGVMLPYTPLHELLMEAGVLVMTSGNLGDEPIAIGNDEAWERLGSLADGFLMHDRDIETFADDSVVRHHEGRELPIRRSRGYAPFPVPLAAPLAPVLAVGGELKSTACLTREHYAFLSPHIGDLGNLETLEAMTRATGHLERLFHVTPQAIVCDLHPAYLSTRWAKDEAARRGVPLVAVQHHHAHAMALHAEHGLPAGEPLLAVVFDGTGYGVDGTIWGGEVLRSTAQECVRVAHLDTVWLPGGDAAIRRPSRVALAHLFAAGVAWDDRLPPVADASGEERRVLGRQLERGTNCVQTSSMGRLLDAIASIAGVRHRITYEGQAAIEFEALGTGHHAEPGEYRFSWDTGTPDRFSAAPLVTAAARDALDGVAPATISARTHAAVASLIIEIARRHARPGDPVGMTGGVFQNVALLAAATAGLRHAGFRPIWHQVVPPNDGGLALGQAVIGASRLGWGD